MAAPEELEGTSLPAAGIHICSSVERFLVLEGEHLCGQKFSVHRRWGNGDSGRRVHSLEGRSSGGEQVWWGFKVLPWKERHREIFFQV